MSDKATITIEVTPEKRDEIEQAAREWNYKTADVYLLALYEEDNAVDEENGLTNEQILENFKQGWHEVMTGQTRPAREVLEEMRLEAEQEKAQLLEDFRNSWHAAMKGDARPMQKLIAELEDFDLMTALREGWREVMMTEVQPAPQEVQHDG